MEDDQKPLETSALVSKEILRQTVAEISPHFLVSDCFQSSHSVPFCLDQDTVVSGSFVIWCFVPPVWIYLMMYRVLKV